MKRKLSMKKQAVVMLAVMMLAGVTACGKDKEHTEDSAADQESVMGTEAPDHNAEMYIYGQAEIPDIPCGNGSFEGKADLSPDSGDSVKLQQALDCMVFETHTFGEYMVRLVGDMVRTDSAGFPGSIYVQNLRVEVETNGEKLEESGFYNDTVIYVSQFMTEYRLFTDKIGSYLDVYDLDCPVIAMRYYFEDNDKRAVTKAVEFAVIGNEGINSGFAGAFEEGLGVMLNPDGDAANSETMLTVNDADGETCRVGIFQSDEFTAVDGKTLVDKEAGIRYLFHFSDPLQFELFTAEKNK